MAEHSPEQDQPREPEGAQDNPLAVAFRKLREGRGGEAANLYHDIVKPRQTPLMAHIARGEGFMGCHPPS